MCKVSCHFGWESKADAGRTPLSPGAILTGGKFGEIRYKVGKEVAPGEFEVSVEASSDTGVPGTYWKPWGSVSQ